MTVNQEITRDRERALESLVNIGSRIKMTKKREKNFKEFGTATVSGIICNKCGETLPEIFAADHLDVEFSTNYCPHKPEYIIE